jgi:hypothetical protein
MNKQDIKFQAKEDIARLQNSVLRVISAFPSEKWGMNQVRVGMVKLMENPELLTK